MMGEGAFTAIGSWPHRDIDKITGLILDNFNDLPAWPQLPKIDFYENMYVQFSEGLPDIVVDTSNEKIYFQSSDDSLGSIQTVYENYLSENYAYFAISEKYAKGLYEFHRKIKRRGKLPAIKGQTLGPVSLGLTLTDEKKRAIIYNEQMADAVLKSCVCKTLWQANFLKDLAEEVILFIDEPYLVSFGSAYVNITRDQIITMLNEVIDKLHEGGIITGVHCCGNTDWSILMDTNVDILNFDAYNYSESIMLYPEKINAFLEKNKALAWGIIPTAEEKIFSETSESLYEKMMAQQKKLASLGVSQDLQRKTIITPSCGTASLSEDAALQVIELLKGVSKYYKES